MVITIEDKKQISKKLLKLTIEEPLVFPLQVLIHKGSRCNFRINTNTTSEIHTHTPVITLDSSFMSSRH